MTAFRWKLFSLFLLWGHGGFWVCSEARAQSGVSAVSTNRYSAGVEFYGLAPYPNSSTGARLGYLIGRSVETELSYIESKKTVLMADYQFRELGLRLKHFLNPLVHWGIGVVSRQLDLKYDVFLKDAQEEHIAEKRQALAGNAHLGVETTLFNVITIGSDLFTYSAPFRWEKSDNEFPENAGPAEEDPKELPYVASGFEPHMQFLRTYVKVRF